ncbi:MAG: hypothetical protein GX561_11490 [Lentisphaerae bacterium]|jgi:hypothetical protein|nr:hypothetical protein [Lentisphaerota bacterium]
MLRSSFGKVPTGNQIKPLGWLRRQLQIQADGQAGQLDKFWPDVKDSAWLGGHAEGWERVPYWLDGFIDLAWLLDDDDMKARAKRYIDAILERQEPDGWICPCSKEHRGDYDLWAVALLSKVLYVWQHRTNDQRVKPALIKAFKNFAEHIKEHPLVKWGKFRWYESLIALAWLYEETGEAWLLNLADEIRKQSFHYPELLRNWPYFNKESHWTYEAHVVNLAMAIHSEMLYQKMHPENSQNGSEFAEDFLAKLMQYHSMATGHFTGDECLAGDSPSQGTEFCSVVETMFSYELLFAQTGNTVWADRLEKLAFNALPATCTADMWAHQYNQQTNQIGCLAEPKQIWTTNSVESNRFGLEPNYGCCTANHGQGWPKLAANTFLLSDKAIIVALLLPAQLDANIDGAGVKCTIQTNYPFEDTAKIIVETDKPVDFVLKLRIPGSFESAEVEGRPATPGTIECLERTWSGTTVIDVRLSARPKLVQRPRNLMALHRGPLLFSLPIKAKKTMHEYERNGVQRKFPYCDYEFAPVESWNYAFASEEFKVSFNPISDYPFDESKPPVVIAATMKQIPWEVQEGTVAVAESVPRQFDSDKPCEQKILIPYGSTILRMTEMPLCKPCENS